MSKIDAKTIEIAMRVFTEVAFINPDIGPLNDVLNVDYFVISIPKCGTTAIQRGLERVGRSVIHVHTDVSIYAAFENGNVLRENGLGMGAILRARLATNSRPVHIFFGYREPVSWYLSLAAFFSLPLDASLGDNIIHNVEQAYPWSKYKINDIASILRDGTEVELLTSPFDHENGCTIIKGDRFNIIFYRFDRLDRARDYIVENIDDRFVLNQERVNDDPAYHAYRSTFLPPIAALQRLHRDPWFCHAYSPSERQALLQTYNREV